MIFPIVLTQHQYREPSHHVFLPFCPCEVRVCSSMAPLSCCWDRTCCWRCWERAAVEVTLSTRTLKQCQVEERKPHLDETVTTPTSEHCKYIWYAKKTTSRVIFSDLKQSPIRTLSSNFWPGPGCETRLRRCLCSNCLSWLFSDETVTNRIY